MFIIFLIIVVTLLAIMIAVKKTRVFISFLLGLAFIAKSSYLLFFLKFEADSLAKNPDNIFLEWLHILLLPIRALAYVEFMVGIIFFVVSLLLFFKMKNQKEIEIKTNSFPKEKGVVENLEELHTLFKKGIITQEEFEAAKKKTLNNL